MFPSHFYENLHLFARFYGKPLLFKLKSYWFKMLSKYASAVMKGCLKAANGQGFRKPLKLYLILNIYEVKMLYSIYYFSPFIIILNSKFSAT